MNGSSSPAVLENMTADEVRSCVILLPEALLEVDVQSIEAALRESDAILCYQLEDHRLSLDYSYPDLTFADVWGIINDNLDNVRFGAMRGWKYKLRAFLETNEQQHRLSQYGWQKYIADIYVANHYYERQVFNKKKLWQHYTRPIAQKKKGSQSEAG
jgi:hypothetical protein